MKKFVLAAIVAMTAIPAVFAEGNKEETTTAPTTEEAGQEGENKVTESK